MEGLMESLDPEKWQTVQPSDKGEGYKDFHVMQKWCEEPKGTLQVWFLDENDEVVVGKVVGFKGGVNPFKGLGACELKISEDCFVLGVDLVGDIVERKEEAKKE